MENRVARAVSLAALLLGGAAWSAGGQSSDPSAAIDADIAATRRGEATAGAPVSSPAWRAPVLQPGAASPAIPQSPSAAVTPGSITGGKRSGDARIGRAFALSNCRPCHVVATGQGAPVRFANAPNFRSIANRPSTNPFSLSVWLSNPHPTMPNLQLTLAEVANVTAYIMSLRH